MNIIFVRHGEINSNVKTIYSGRSQEKLNEKGENQATKVAKDLSTSKLQALFCGPLPRTRQTASIIGEATNLEPKSIDEFNEMKMGPWEGLSEEVVKDNFSEEWELWNNHPAQLILPGRETLEELQGRALHGLRKVLSHCAKLEKICVVSHVAVIRVLMLYDQKRSLNDYRKIEVPNAIPIVIKYDENYGE